MPEETTTRWLKSGRYANLGGIRARPMKHQLLPDMPMAVQRGQAEAVFLQADDSRYWILKRFHQGRRPDESYLRAVGGLLPRHRALESGISRRVLSQRDLQRSWGGYFSSDLARWIDKTLLMPRVKGTDWATLADDLRDGNLQLSRNQRVTLCRDLAQVVLLLESAGCAHRDLSSGNTFIDTNTWHVILIDFDSVYHRSLRMPEATTCGTEGYTAAFVWQGRSARPDATWCVEGDRFALALMCVEFLSLGKGAPLGAEGGMFDQDQIRARRGTAMSLAEDRIQSEFGGALPLFKSAINARRCADCPAPSDWISFCDSVGPYVKPPPLDTFDAGTREDLLDVLSKRVPAAPVWPAPRLDDITVEPVEARANKHPIIALPKDPWALGRPPSSADDSISLEAPHLTTVEDPW